jgi:hypothetical protein
MWWETRITAWNIHADRRVERGADICNDLCRQPRPCALVVSGGRSGGNVNIGGMLVHGDMDVSGSVGITKI